jgi:hypothetical protein
MPRAMDATFASVNILGDAALRNAIMPEPTITGKSIHVRRVLYMDSAFL